LDFAGGQADLKARLIRAIGDLTAVHGRQARLMRAVRFAARFGFAIEPETFAAIRRHATTSAWCPRAAARRTDQVAHRRGKHGRGFELLDEAGLLAEVLPEVAR